MSNFLFFSLSHCSPTRVVDAPSSLRDARDAPILSEKAAPEIWQS